MARSKWKAGRDKRDGGQFIALPLVVLDSPGYRLASYPARAMLVDIAMQYSGGNNGKLTACAKYLHPKGWNSNATIHRAVRDLIDCRLLIETRKGARPNRAAWFALSWLALDQTSAIDIDPGLYRTGGYMRPDKSDSKGAVHAPPAGVGVGSLAPPRGVTALRLAPRAGAMRKTAQLEPAPSAGAYLEAPSATSPGLQAAVAGGGRPASLKRRVGEPV